MKIKLYHGTSQDNADKILEAGFMNGGYLTSNRQQASYYSECASEEDGSEAKVIVVEVDTDNLKADLPSFDEPLTFILDAHGLNETGWHRAIENGQIHLSDADDWQNSLTYVYSALHPNQILVEQIDFADDTWLSDKDDINIEKALRSGADEPPESAVWLAMFETPNTENFAIGYTPEAALSALITHWKKMSACPGGYSDAIFHLRDSVEIAPIVPGTGIGVGISDELWPKTAMSGDDPRFSDIWKAEFKKQQDRGPTQ